MIRYRSRRSLDTKELRACLANQRRRFGCRRLYITLRTKARRMLAVRDDDNIQDGTPVQVRGDATRLMVGMRELPK
jgi:hypothetical protein